MTLEELAALPARIEALEAEIRKLLTIVIGH